MSEPEVPVVPPEPIMLAFEGIVPVSESSGGQLVIYSFSPQAQPVVLYFDTMDSAYNAMLAIAAHLQEKKDVWAYVHAADSIVGLVSYGVTQMRLWRNFPRTRP